MVASLSAISSAGAAASYFSQVDDYYKGGEHAPAEWHGKGAEALGLAGAIDAEAFKNLLAGKLPDGQMLGRINAEGEIEHKPGWDMCFSAPKSVSIMALVADDTRLIDAHEAAVRETLNWLEKEAAITRHKAGDGTVTIEATENLAIATFRHATSREQQPQLHTHSVVLNLTQRDDGNWRSLESRAMYRLQMEAGERYRANLAMKVNRLGYQVERTKAGELVSFEIGGVPKDLIEKFSDRSRQIEEALEARGKTRETATAAERDMAAVSTRQAKQDIDRADLRAAWNSALDPLHHDLYTVSALARAELMDPVQQQTAETREQNAARSAVREAAEHLSERDARFSHQALHEEARRLALGKAGEEAIEKAIQTARTTHELGDRTARGFDHQTGQIVEAKGYATAASITNESEMLATAARAQGSAQPLATDAAEAQARQEARSGFRFNEGQAKALAGILTSGDRIHLVQGYAGTAKTTSVLAAVAAEAAAKGEKITALAPTASAAETLGGAIHAEGKTVASHIHARNREGGIWIVDEASMVATRDMKILLDQAEKASARLVLVGDVSQLGSVEAGAAFRQLQQESGLKCHVLDEIVRQTNQATREAVEASIRGNAAEAMQKLEQGGGSVKELATREERLADIADRFTNQTAEARAASIVIAPGRDDRAALNDAIRQRLTAAGVLSGQAASVETLVAKDLTTTQAKRAENYAAGDMLRAARDYSKWGIQKGDYVRVSEVDQGRNRLSIQTSNGREIQLNPRTATRWQCFTAEARELQAGDRITFKLNDQALDRKNGHAATVTGIDADAGKATIKTDKGEIQTLDLRQARHGHWSHAYAQTAHESQGRTCDRVFVHAESSRLNLTTQQMMYVAISRAREEAHIVTDSKDALGLAVAQRTGQKAQALETKQERGFSM